MTVWRPAETIHVKALGLAWRERHLLAAEVEDDSGRTTGVRPLGGTIEFGETRQQALEREFVEELGATIRITGEWHALENIYQHEGFTGHEFVFAADVEFVEEAWYQKDEIVFTEHNGFEIKAKWFALNELAPLGLELYPTGLEDVLRSARPGQV